MAFENHRGERKLTRRCMVAGGLVSIASLVAYNLRVQDPEKIDYYFFGEDHDWPTRKAVREIDARGISHVGLEGIPQGPVSIKLIREVQTQRAQRKREEDSILGALDRLVSVNDLVKNVVLVEKISSPDFSKGIMDIYSSIRLLLTTMVTLRGTVYGPGARYFQPLQKRGVTMIGLEDLGSYKKDNAASFSSLEQSFYQAIHTWRRDLKMLSAPQGPMSNDPISFFFTLIDNVESLGASYGLIRKDGSYDKKVDDSLSHLRNELRDQRTDSWMKEASQYSGIMIIGGGNHMPKAIKTAKKQKKRYLVLSSTG